MKQKTYYFDLPLETVDPGLLAPSSGKIIIKLRAARRIHEKMREPLERQSITRYIEENYPLLKVGECKREPAGRWYVAKVEVRDVQSE